MKQILLLHVLLLSILMFLSNCGDDEDSPALQEITIKSSNGNRLDIISQEETTLSVSGIDQFGNAYEISGEILWSVDNEHVVIDNSGVVTAQSIGTSVITAEVEGVIGFFAISVWDSSAPRTEIYVSDVGINRNGPHLIIRYDESGANPETFISSGLSRPQDIVFLEDQGILLVSSLGSDDIDKFDIETGNRVGSFAANLAAPTRIDIGPDSLLYVLPWEGGPIKRYQLDGTFVDDFNTLEVNQSIGMAWDTEDVLYVSSFNDGSGGFVRKFDTDGTHLGFFINNNLSGPTDIWFDEEGNLFVNDWSANSVKKFSAEGTFLEVFISNVSQPEGVAFLDDGSILIGASGSGSIKRYEADGTFIEDFVTSGSGGLTTPNAVIVRKVN